MRNFIAHRILGFEAMKHAIANRLAEITIDYPDSPLNAGSQKGIAGVRPGQRLIAALPFGSGDTPRFALIATDDKSTTTVVQRYAHCSNRICAPLPMARGFGWSDPTAM
jgi:hypothetical protein